MHAYSSFEHNIWNTQLGSRVYIIIGIYHLPESNDQQFNNSNYTDQFTDLLTELPKQQDAQTLLNTIADFKLKQHVNIPTHNLGHKLDVIITPATYHGSLIAGPYISDHRFITLKTSHTKPKPKLEKRTL